MSRNSTGGCRLDHPEGAIVAYVGVSMSSLVICENILGMITIWRSPTLHTNANRLIFSLALADMNVGIGFFVGHVGNLANPRVMNSQYMISFIFGFVTSMFMLSSCHMAVIAIDRYVFIVHPFYYVRKMTRRRILIMTWSTWIAAVLFGLGLVVGYGDDKYLKNCILTNPPVESYALMAITYIISIIIVCVSYLKIALVAYNHKKATTARKINTPGFHTSALARNNRKAIMKSVKFFLIMFGVYFTCTGVAGLMAAIVTSKEISIFVHEFAMILFLVNSGINFIVYSHMSKDFYDAWKKTLSDLIQCCCR